MPYWFNYCKARRFEWYTSIINHKDRLRFRAHGPDEIGTPFCVTIDFTTLEDQAVTVRDRDSMWQIRLHMDDLPTYLLRRVR